jgi:sugar lactone lactonase YvrE
MQKSKGKNGKILRVTPEAAIAGGEIIIETENFVINSGDDVFCFFNGVRQDMLVAASADRVIATVPRQIEIRRGGKTQVILQSRRTAENRQNFTENAAEIVTGHKVIDDLHLVANPAYDRREDCLIVTRSGARGQRLPQTLFRLRVFPKTDLKNGEPRTIYQSEIENIEVDIINPTGIAFSPSGEMFVTSRAEGVVYKITGADEAVPFASDLGIATGIAFDNEGEMYVGDRAGTIYKINALGYAEVFATLEQSIAAYHLAFGADGALYATRPNVASFDSVMRIDEDGEVSTFYRGLGRPQGLAFDRAGNLYVAACLRQRRGIVKISPDGKQAELFVSGMKIVGLCFGKNGEMYVATNEAVFRLDLEIEI